MRNVTPWIWLAALLIAAQAEAVTPGPSGNYGKIAQRNVFALKNGPDPVPQTNAPPPPLQKVVLKGITTILGNKLAFLSVQPIAKTGPAPKEETLMLAEGQREAGVEVLEIDPKSAQVKVNNSGTVMPITFEKPSDKGSAPAPTPNPPRAAEPFPAPNLAPQPQTPSNSVQPRLPSFRNLRMQGRSATPPMPTLPTAVPAPIQTTTPSQVVAQPQAPAAAPLTADEQALLQELEKAAAPPQPRTVPAQLQRPPTMPQLPQ
jgi:hypothetical protein